MGGAPKGAPFSVSPGQFPGFLKGTVAFFDILEYNSLVTGDASYGRSIYILFEKGTHNEKEKYECTSDFCVDTGPYTDGMFR